jgi:hypothetical protein
MKQVTSLLFFLLIVAQSIASVPNWAWSSAAGASNNQNSAAVCADLNGDVYAIGYFQQDTILFGNILLHNPDPTANALAIYLVKYDASGNVMWAKSAGGSNYNYGCSVSTDASGNVYITGYFQSNSIIFGNDTLVNANTFNNYADIFLVKYDTHGNELWANRIGASGDEYAQSVCTDASGNVMITGYFTSPTLSIGNISLNSFGNGDIFIAKFDTGGNVLWAQNAGGVYDDKGTAVSTDASDNIFVTGNFNSGTISFGNISINNTGYTNLFIAKYNANGNLIWVNKAGGTSNDYALDVACDASGNAYVTGRYTSASITFGSTTFTKANNNLGDVFIVKYSALGNVLWAKNASGAADDICNSICVDANKHLLISGSFNSANFYIDGDTLINVNSSGYVGDVFLAQFDSAGTLLWSSSHGGNMHDEGLGICADASNNIFLTGNFYSPSINFGSNTLPNADNTGYYPAMFLAKIGTCSYSTYANENACTSFLSPSGHLYYASGLYRDTLLSSAGCDSILNLHINIDAYPNSNIHLSGDSLIAIDSTANYQWIDCISNTLVAGANNMIFNPTQNGSYAVILNHGTCTDTSNCINYTHHCQAQFYLYPDSTQSSFWFLVNQCMGSDSLSADSLSYTWMWGDSANSVSVGPYPTFTYTTAGYYTICVDIIDSISGCNSSFCDSAYIAKSMLHQILTVQVISPNNSGLTSNFELASKDDHNIKLYPNPAQNMVQVQFLSPQNGSLQLIHIAGEKLATYQLTNTSASSIDLKNLSEGIYFIEIKTEQGVFVKKLIKTH